MNKKISLEDVIQALNKLGGEAQSKEIKKAIRSSLNTVPDNYKNLKSFEETIQVIIQTNCPQENKYIFGNRPIFTKISRGRFRLNKDYFDLNDNEPTGRRISTLVPEKLILAVQQDLAGIQAEEEILEGTKSARLVAHYERNPKLRATAIHHHGTTCKGCGFNFLIKYGEHGRSYIEVHHLVPLSTMVEPSAINPKTDLTVLCSNCHRMVHRKRERPLSLNELKAIVQSATS